MRCKIGRHTCDAMKIDNKILSEAELYWSCDDCNQQFMTEYIGKLDKNTHFKGCKGNDENDKEQEKAKKVETVKKKIKDKKNKETEKLSSEEVIVLPQEISIPNKEQKKEEPADQPKEKKKLPTLGK